MTGAASTPPGRRIRRKMVVRWLQRAERALGVVAVVTAPPWFTLTLIDLFGDAGVTGRAVAAILLPVVFAAAIVYPLVGLARSTLQRTPDAPHESHIDGRRRL